VQIWQIKFTFCTLSWLNLVTQKINLANNFPQKESAHVVNHDFE